MKSEFCSCVRFILECDDSSTIQIDMYYGGTLNGRPYYIGTYQTSSYILYWDDTYSQWYFKDQSDSNIIFYSDSGNSTACAIDSDEWHIDNPLNFTYCDLTSVTSQTPECSKPTQDTCGDCSCYYFSATSNYTVYYYDCDDNQSLVTLQSGGTTSLCVKGIPVILPPNPSNFYSANTSNVCNYGCFQSGYCECLSWSIPGSEFFPPTLTYFSIAGSINGKTFWKKEQGGSIYTIYWDGNKWILTKDDSEIAYSNSDILCPPNGIIGDDWDGCSDLFGNTCSSTLTTVDCIPTSQSEKDCWTIQNISESDDQIITYYDGTSTKPINLVAQPENVVEVCAYGEPECSTEDCSISASTNSCQDYCGSSGLCGCIKLTITCESESPSQTGSTTTILTPSGSINGKPFYVNGDYVLQPYKDYWAYYSQNYGLLFESETTESICPTGLTYNFVASEGFDYESFCECVTEYTQIFQIYLTVEPMDCPLPSPTPTPTPTPTPVQKLINSCEPLTIYNMEASCVIVNPSTSTSNDGAASLFISGGTPPYTVTWSNGNVSPAIGNLTVGSYSATVVDFYGDYTAKTVCVLTAPVIPTTPTPTPTPTMIPTGPPFCMLIRDVSPPKQETGPVLSSFSLNQTFTVDSFVNGQPSWISSDLLYRVYFNTSVTPSVWQLSGSPSWINVINTNSANPPINGDWQILGGYGGGIDVTEGACEPYIPALGKIVGPLTITNPDIQLYVVRNNPKCGCEGSIIANASEGNSPYEYTIDGGITYKKYPIFDNLCSGVYTVTVRDLSGYTKSSQVTLNPPENKTIYVVNLTKTSNVLTNTGIIKTTTNEVKLNVTPSLPSTATITFDIIHTNNFQSSVNENSASLNTNTVLSLNGIPQSYTTNTISTGTTVNTINGCQNQFVYLTGNSEVWQGLTYGSLDDLTINTTTTVVKNFTTGCDIGDSQDTYYVTNLKINGCNCCSVQNITL
jgi:hypothetical protein